VAGAAGSRELRLTARAGRPAYEPGALPRSRGEAIEVERAVAPEVVLATHEEVWAQVSVDRAAGALRGGDLLGPVETLREHDAAHGSEYVRTLAAWLDHPGHPADAARSIHVHANTMRYRMHRIADLAGLDLDDPIVRLAVRLQLAAVHG
jgi:sugar diacid utilization regulator